MVMRDRDKNRIIELYESRYDTFGYDVKSVGWGNIESQDLRFRILSEIADISSSSVCDLGCGFGDLYPYLRKHFDRVEYFGIDISGKLINEAKKRYPQANVEVRDILHNPPQRKYDYVFSSGTLSFKLPNHKKYIEKMLRAMMAMSSKGVSVNFLSSYVDYQLEKNFHFAPEEALRLAKKITKFVTLRHDYPLYEFTLYLYHDWVSGF